MEGRGGGWGGDGAASLKAGTPACTVTAFSSLVSSTVTLGTIGLRKPVIMLEHECFTLVFSKVLTAKLAFKSPNFETLEEFHPLLLPIFTVGLTS